MDARDVARVEARLQARLRPWIGQAGVLVEGKVKDARAHADKALTDTLRDTPDGRATAAKVQRSPSFRAALSRLDELYAALVGLVQDARVAFYEDSIPLWLPFIREEYRVVKDPGPTEKGRAIMRAAIIHGYTLQHEIKPGVDQAKTRLAVTLNSAARRGALRKVGTDLLGLWRRDTTSHLLARTISALSDSDSAIHQTVGLMLIRDEHRGEVFPSVAGAT